MVRESPNEREEMRELELDRQALAESLADEGPMMDYGEFRKKLFAESERCEAMTKATSLSRRIAERILSGWDRIQHALRAVVCGRASEAVNRGERHAARLAINPQTNESKQFPSDATLPRGWRWF